MQRLVLIGGAPTDSVAMRDGRLPTMGACAPGRSLALETFRLAEDAEAFARRLEKPRAFAREAGAGLGEYLARALSHRAAGAEPKDLAWLLAFYARDGLARVEAAGDAPSLGAVRSALEEALSDRTGIPTGRLRSAGDLYTQRTFGVRSCRRHGLTRSSPKSALFGTNTRLVSTTTWGGCSGTSEPERRLPTASMSAFPLVVRRPI